MTNLMDLPPELRNRIFGYALTTANGRARIVYSLRKYQFPDGEQSIQVTKWRCVDSDLDDINNLAFVSKQARAETKGVEIKHNTILFGAPWGTIHQSILFFNTWMEQTRCREWPPRIYFDKVEGTPGFEGFDSAWWLLNHSRSFKTLLGWCANYANIKVHLSLPGLSYTAGAFKPAAIQRFIEHSVALQLALRGIDQTYLSPLGMGPTEEESKKKLKTLGALHFLQQDRDTIKKLGRKAPNLRIHTCDSFLNVKAFRDLAKYRPFSDRPPTKSLVDKNFVKDGRREQWVEFLEEIFTKGI